MDVTNREPLPGGHSLHGFDNVVLTPHIDGWTIEAIENVAATTARDMIKVLGGDLTPRGQSRAGALSGAVLGSGRDTDTVHPLNAYMLR